MSLVIRICAAIWPRGFVHRSIPAMTAAQFQQIIFIDSSRSGVASDETAVIKKT